MGQAVTGDADSYRYLVESIRQFPQQVRCVGAIALTHSHLAAKKNCRSNQPTKSTHTVCATMISATW